MTAAVYFNNGWLIYFDLNIFHISTMITITREQAICMFFYEEFNEENVARLVPKIDSMEDLEICYLNDDPTEPVLMHIQTIHGDPFKFRLYPAQYEPQT